MATGIWRWLLRILPFLAALTVCVAIFWPVLPLYQVLPSPDSGPFYLPHQALRWLESTLVQGTSIAPHWLLWLVLPELHVHDLTYLVDSLLLAAAGALYLTGRHVRPGVAWLAGTALGFSGYTFTLVSAGHRGYFHMMAYTVFAFGLILRGFESRRVTPFMLLGLCLGWGALNQPDVFVLVLALAAAYALWLTFSRAAARPDEGCGRRLVRVWPRFLWAVAAFMLAGGSVFRTVFADLLPHRLAQIAQTSRPPSAVGPVATPDPAAAASERAQAAHEQWIFATDWSLPPEDMLEFVVPCVFGTQPRDAKRPYWGRLGRTFGWWQNRQGFLSFRQHTIYLGAVQVAFACFAVWAWVARRRRGRDEPLEPWLRDVPFWIGACAVALVLACGRYTPFYRLFYHVPGMALLRAPVKFVHLAEIGTACLFGCGLMAALTSTATAAVDYARRRTVTRWTVATLAGAGLLLMGAVWVRAGAAPLITHWQAMGIAGLAPVLARQMAGALLHGALLIALAAGLGWLVASRRAPVAVVLAILWLAVGCDLVAVNRRFIEAADVAAWYRPNPIAKRVRDAVPLAPVVANYATPNTYVNWFTCAALSQGIANCVPAPHNRATTPAGQLMSTLAHDPVRFWEISGASFAVIPAQAARGLTGGRTTLIDVFGITDGRVVPAGEGSEAQALLRVAHALPPVWLSPAWTNVAPARQAAWLAGQTGDLRMWVAIGGDCPPERAGFGTDARVGDVHVERWRNADGALATRVDANVPAPRLLTVRMAYDPNLVACLDGQRVPVWQSTGLWTGVWIPAGRHTVTLRAPRKWLWPAASLLTLALVPTWLLLPIMQRLCHRNQPAARGAE